MCLPTDSWRWFTGHLRVLGKYEGVEEGKKQIEVDPDVAYGYFNSATNFIALDRLGEAENLLQRASERKLVIPEFSVDRFDHRLSEG